MSFRHKQNFTNILRLEAIYWFQIFVIACDIASQKQYPYIYLHENLSHVSSHGVSYFDSYDRCSIVSKTPKL